MWTNRRKGLDESIMMRHFSVLVMIMAASERSRDDVQ